MTATECKSDVKLTTDTSYLALTGELWGVCCENFEENWPRYNGTALYFLNTVVQIHESCEANPPKMCLLIVTKNPLSTVKFVAHSLFLFFPL